MKALRVLWVVKELAVGGAERLLLEMLPAFEESISFIPAAVRNSPRTMDADFRKAGFSPLFLGAKGRAGVGWVPALQNAVRRYAPDVIHFHNPQPAAIARMSLTSSNIPFVYTEHNVWHSYHPLSRWANAATYWRNDAIIAVSLGVQESILSSRWGRAARRKLWLVPNGIDDEAVRRDANRQARNGGGRLAPSPSYGTVGHLMYSKGIDVLLRASKLIERELPEANGYVVGSGKDEDDLERMRTALGAHRTHFLGLRYDARALTEQLDVFVVSSRVEGLPLALLEAMALGRPIVATRVGGIPSAIEHGRNGLLVPPADPGALASAILRLLHDRDLARALGKAAQDTVGSEFTTRSTAQGYLRVYRSLNDGGRRR